MDIQSLLLVGLTAVFGIIGWLLSNKDAKQAEEIKLLFKKHDDDSKELMELRIKIAEQHYQKPELDAKFSDINATLKTGFAGLEASIKEMSKSFLSHVSDHNHKDGQ
jgi:hypothetical protein